MSRTPEDPFDLARFVTAQKANYHDAIAELRNGRKRSHWMWYVLPQVEGLGSTEMAKRYAITSRCEAEAYLAHPVLGRRLVECAEALLRIQGKTTREIMGHPDCLKLRSSMTLFAELAPPDSPFAKVLKRYYESPDPHTIEFLKKCK